MQLSKLVFITFFIIGLLGFCNAQITLSSQADVDAWDQSITVLTEDLTITGSDITNIDALSNLVNIESELKLLFNDELLDLEGLSGLKNVSGFLNIDRNNKLLNIDGLSGLENIEGEIFLNSNDALTSIDGFLGLTNVTGKLTIQSCDALLGINGLSNLSSLSGTIILTVNNTLSNVDGFAGLQDIPGSLLIKGNEALSNIDGLSGLMDLTGTLEIQTSGLTNINVFSGLTDIAGILRIRDNPNLSNLNGLSNLSDLSGRLFIINNPGLTNIDELIMLTEFSGLLAIQSNQNLSNINGLSSIINLNGEININANHGLSNFEGLSNLETISGALTIINNDGLVNLDELSGLKTITGELEVSHNANLENIDALSELSNVTGEIHIENNDNLSDLTAFSNVTNFLGSLIIDDNDGIVNLDEFSNLTELPGSIFIRDNISLLNIDGFSGLQEIVGKLYITNNDLLEDLKGLSNLTSVSGQLWINQNSGLTNIDDLFNLSSITGRVDISENENLNDLSGLSNLSDLEGGLYIFSNYGLTHVDGLSEIKSVQGSLVIARNPALENINGLIGIENISPSAKVEIDENISLTNIDGLSGLVNADGNLFISENPSLENIDGLSVLNEVSSSADIRIVQNDLLMNLDGFSNLKYVYRHLLIINNKGLTNVDAFSQIEEISSTGHLEIRMNPNLENIDGLSGLKRVIGLGRLSIENNNALTNLDGLFGLEETTGRITVRDNDLLSSCCGLSEAIEDGLMQDFVIDTNRVGCNSAEEILDACSLSLFWNLVRPCEEADNGRINFFANDYDAIPFTYEWEETSLGISGNSLSDSDQFSIDNLAAGSYNVTVTLPNGARESIQGIVLDPITGSVFEITKLTSTNSTNGTASGNLYIEYSGGTAPYTLEWLGPNSDSRDDIMTSNYTMFGLGPGEYTVQLIDAEGQSKTVDIVLLDEVVPVFPCTEPLDIVILNDVSGSVDAVEYSESKTFFVNFVQAANIGEDEMESQAAIIEWSSNPQQSVVIPLTGNINELESYESADRAFSDGTALHSALQFGYDYLEENGRADVERVLLLSTDGYPSPSLIALADEFKAEGYHIITIAFDDAYERGNLRDILTLTASVPLLASGAPAYSDLDADLADNIVNRYLCPLAPGESSSVYFNRDGEIVIDSLVGECPISQFAELTFTVSALRELSIPAGTSVMFYHNDPLQFGATPILDYSLPCAIPVGTSESHTITLPVNGATKLYALLNDDGRATPPLSFPITDLEEIAYSNNIDTVSICINERPTLQALKYTTTPTPICDSILMYTIDVCNISTTDAFGVVVTDNPPVGSSLISSIFNDNGCAIYDGATYDIAANCCASISLSYNASGVVDGYYGIQNVDLSGPDDQDYIGYQGDLSTAEDVVVDETVENCPSTEIWFTKEVNDDEVCEDEFLVYTYTIHNETNSVIQGARFIDILPEPMEWVYKPYFLNGLSVNTQQLSGTVADFIIDEIAADTIATFQIDAYTGDWNFDGLVSSAASLENVVDLENGGFQTLVSNTAGTIVFESEGSNCDSLWTAIETFEVDLFSSVVVYPNPTNQNIQIKNLSEPVGYKLMNSLGQVYESGVYDRGILKPQVEGINLLHLFSADGQSKSFKVIRL